MVFHEHRTYYLKRFSADPKSQSDSIYKERFCASETCKISYSTLTYAPGSGWNCLQSTTLPLRQLLSIRKEVRKAGHGMAPVMLSTNY
jgi:hypothetical protein